MTLQRLVIIGLLLVIGGMFGGSLSWAQPPDLCTQLVAVTQAASTQLITGVTGTRTWICGIILVSATAQSISLVEGTGSVCATGIAGVIGGTTASVALAINGGFAAVSAGPWVRTVTLADNVCLLQSGTGNVSGIISYQTHP